MTKFILPITNYKLLFQTGISTKQARLLLSLTEQELVCFEEIASTMGWSSVCDARNQVKALEAKGLVSEYDKKGRTIRWGITPAGIRLSQELRGHPAPEQIPTLKAIGNTEEIIYVAELKEPAPADQDEMEKVLNVLHQLPAYASKFPWFKEAVLSRLDLNKAA